jgi:hypothetical protein
MVFKRLGWSRILLNGRIALALEDNYSWLEIPARS